MTTARRISRRTALARALQLGAAAAVAGSVRDIEARRVTSIPSPEAQPASAALIGPEPPTPAVSLPTPRPAVRLAVAPTGIVIPALGIDAPIATAELTSGGREIVVPESGLVSPNTLLGSDAVNRIWVLGHSRWHRVPQLLYTVGGLEVGDRIEVAGSELVSGRPLPALAFDVEQLVVADVESTGKYVYGPPPEAPRLVIQTSARQAWDPVWILDREVLLAKADIDLEGDIDDLARYLLLLVTARARPETVAALASIATG